MHNSIKPDAGEGIKAASVPRRSANTALQRLDSLEDYSCSESICFLLAMITQVGQPVISNGGHIKTRLNKNACSLAIHWPD